MEYNILVVEDECGIRETIRVFLKNQGYHVYLAENGKEGLEIIKNCEIHLAIVDIMMPVMDGITMTIRLRESYDFPVIFLSAKSEDMDKITGLNVGADDYVTKPFEPMELMARVNSNLRRYSQIIQLRKGGQEESYLHILQVGDLYLNVETKEVRIRNQDIHLTANVGGLRNCQSGESIQVTPTVFLSPNDVSIIKKWNEIGTQIGIRQIPGEKDIWVDEVLFDE